MRKIYLFMALCLMSVINVHAKTTDEIYLINYCFDLVGTGDFDDVIFGEIDATQYYSAGMVSLAFITDEDIYIDSDGHVIGNGHTGTLFVVTFNPVRLNNLSGTYNLSEGGGVIEVVDGVMSSATPYTGGSLIISLNNEGEEPTYDIVCTMSLQGGDELQGTITGMCTYDFPPEEGIDQISQEPKAKSQKLIRDGMLLIERNGKTYNAQGAEIK